MYLHVIMQAQRQGKEGELGPAADGDRVGPFGDSNP